jgi:hypothetical protein
MDSLSDEQVPQVTRNTTRQTHRLRDCVWSVDAFIRRPAAGLQAVATDHREIVRQSAPAQSPKAFAAELPGRRLEVDALISPAISEFTVASRGFSGLRCTRPT